jgi:hypothetical protein
MTYQPGHRGEWPNEANFATRLRRWLPLEVSGKSHIVREVPHRQKTLGFGEIRENEAIPFDDLADRDVDRLAKARAIVNKRMEFAVFAARIDA